jgi:hypothetical protein
MNELKLANSLLCCAVQRVHCCVGIISTNYLGGRAVATRSRAGLCNECNTGSAVAFMSSNTAGYRNWQDGMHFV